MSIQAIKEQITKHKGLIKSAQTRLQTIHMGLMLNKMAGLTEKFKKDYEEHKEEYVKQGKYGECRKREQEAKIAYSKTIIMLFNDYLNVKSSEFARLMYDRLVDKSTDIIESMGEGLEYSDCGYNEQEYIKICNNFKTEVEFWDKLTSSY